MYPVYLASLILSVYLAPGLALAPRAAFDSRLAFALPILSVLVVTLLARILKLFGVFTGTAVLLVTLVFAAIAVWRLYRLWSGRLRVVPSSGSRQVAVHWPESHRLVYLFSVCTALPSAVRLGLSSFAVDDEIYSWNMWAVQHARGEDHDLSYTVFPYPQTFSYLIAWCYQLLGSIDLQLPVRGGLGILAASFLAAVGTASRRQDSGSLPWFMGLALFTLFLAGLHIHGLSRGLAEVLMIPALAVSVALHLQYARLRDAGTPEAPAYLWLACAAALLAGISKQQALIWLMITFPILLTAETVRRRRSLTALIPVAAVWGGGLLWLVTEGSGFLGNTGVIEASQRGRTWLEQLLHASNVHLAGRPAVLVLLIWCAWVVLRGRRGRGVFFGLVIPSLLLWFLFGAYNLRLGMHAAAVAALLIAANSFWPRAGGGESADAGVVLSTRIRHAVHGLAAAVAVLSGVAAWRIFEDRGPDFSLYDGGRNTIQRYFGDDAEFVYRSIYRGAYTLWIPSNYVYGVFYGHNPIVRPFPVWAPVTAEQIEADIVRDRPDYLFDAGDHVGPWPARYPFRELVAECGDWFEKVAGPSTGFEYIVYRLDHGAIDRNRECSP